MCLRRGLVDATQLRARRHTGLSLVELLMAATILAMLAGGVAALSIAVQASSDFHYGRGLALQHGRVALERMERTLNSAHASQSFPGFVVFAESEWGVSWPDTLVAWSPGGTVSEPDGLPLFRELVVFCVDPQFPQRLLEIRPSEDSRTVPPLDDIASWQSELISLKQSQDVERVVLTDLLRVAPVFEGPAAPLRGAVRFHVALRPSAAEWEEYQDGERAWEEVSWVQDIYGGGSGLRQVWCGIELQLRPGDVNDHSLEAAIPVFGSAAMYYELRR
jgi:hypothetical protein